MNKLFRILGIAAMIAAIGFSFTACGGDSGGGGSGDTYDSAINDLGTEYSKFTDVDELSNAPKAQAEALYNEFRKGPFVPNGNPDEDTGLSLSDMKAYLRGVGVLESDIDLLAEKTTSQGFMIAGRQEDNNYGIIACRKL